MLISTVNIFNKISFSETVCPNDYRRHVNHQQVIITDYSRDEFAHMLEYCKTAPTYTLLHENAETAVFLYSPGK